MIDAVQIEAIVAKAVIANLRGESVGAARAVSTLDSVGNEAVLITITVLEGAEVRLSGDDVLNTLADIQFGLANAGDERVTIVEFATEGETEELAEAEF